ncbi:MAG: hypothetical protein R2855_12025 [Thermomicrobiales bacterium]
MDGWDNYFVAQAGAAAAFAGLVLVSVSINLDKIIKGPGLVGRSAEPLIVLFTLFVTASFMLIPEQVLWVYGIEVLATAIVFSATIGHVLWRQHKILFAPDNPFPPPPHSFQLRLALCLATAILLMVAGVLLTLDHERGAFALVPAMVVGFLLAFMDAWVLLIEVDR